MSSYPADPNYPTYPPNSEHNAFVTQGTHIVSGFVYTEPSPSHSQNVYDDPRQLPAQEDSFVSPVTYDPSSGIYFQTFPEEYSEFLRQFGQRIYIPETGNSQQEEWSYHDAQTSTAEQPSGFYYNTGNHTSPLDASMSSPTSDDDAASMLQYIASPTPDPAQVDHRYVDNTSTPLASPNLSRHPQPAACAPPVFKVEEELMQPHMIVPSQRRLGDFMEELRRRELPVKVPTHHSSADPWTNPLPFQQPSALSSVVAITSHVAHTSEQQHERYWATQMHGQSSGHPAHDLHSVTPEVASPSVSSPESDDSHSHSHSHSHSPKAKPRAVSRGWSPHRRSPTPRASSQGIRLSPLPHNKKVAADAETRPALACLFCRGRKIACGPPLPGSTDKSCNQCARRHLKCEYPTESRRGMRRRNKTSDKVKPAKITVKGARKRATR